MSIDPGIIVGSIGSFLFFLLLILVVVGLARAVQIVPQSRALVIERLGKFHSVMFGGFHVLIPFVDRIAARVDLREQVANFPPQGVITADNAVVSIDSVVYYQVTDPMHATYEISDYIRAIEQLTGTTLRNVIGSLELEATLTSRDSINGQLRGVLDEATGKWGIRVTRVELKAIEPPPQIQQAMEQQLRADRDKRAAILTAEGVRQSQILQAEGEKAAAVLKAEGQAQAAITRANGEAEAIQSVFNAIHRGNPTPDLLSYQYLQMLPQIAEGDSSKIWVIPTELTAALDAVAKGFGSGEKH